MSYVYKAITYYNLDEFNIEVQSLFDEDWFIMSPMVITSGIHPDSGNIYIIYAQQFARYIPNDSSESQKK